MNNDQLLDDIRRIIAKQTNNELPVLHALPVLPQIGTSSTNKLSTNYIPVTIHIDNQINECDRFDDNERSIKIGRNDEKRKTFNANQYVIPKLEVKDSAVKQVTAYDDDDHFGNLPTTSTGLNCTFVLNKNISISYNNHSIEKLDVMFAEIPTALPTDIVGLQSAVDNLSSNRIKTILNTCRFYDRELRKYLNVPTLVKCFGEVIPSVHSPFSPWRKFLNQLAPKGEFIEYEKILRLVENSKQIENPAETIPDLLNSENIKKAAAMLIPSKRRRTRERCRVQVMMEIKKLLKRYPELNLDRLETATTQKVIQLSEFNMLLEMYGLSTLFQPFYQRLISCFLTYDHKFHYSAFLACLSLIRPSERLPSSNTHRSSQSSLSLPLIKNPNLLFGANLPNKRDRAHGSRS
ncbi:hypothetical protein DICVIV_10408 [Dictyocaulus viviparus]|uniref:Uncharacterized protein n=1 Tax=Dictyocaulus viviparus TaxID=29172 RepID=A0A0D8XMG1_DICVI|nr:hypothetical protein DICVIV_10408 [Dictyocaulus viviparus]